MNDDEKKDMYEYSVLSQAAYHFLRHGKDESELEMASYGFPYKLDDELSDDYSITILRDGKPPVISFRGTDIMEDLIPDAFIFSGLISTPGVRYFYQPTRFRLADEKFDSVFRKHGKPISTGHSLGGTQAIYIGRLKDSQSFSFNPGESPIGAIPHSLYESLYDTDKPQTIYTTMDDFISMSSYLFSGDGDKVIPVPKKDSKLYYSHQLINFMPPKVNSKPWPFYLQPMHRETREKVDMCRVFPELCFSGR